ncbi:hypothetical protein M441DRAFT_410802 [Trichoderma asperellum CBS 433.97]|uniref:Uncharacterized protein n=1 Tax=Trichoderma asperellum (strain ATCC 204424 / CBS 433.97 / NBRC 101777) TaxID=1042311 RepID=A0A2T3Z7C3_TRIA4|nr:hypothetical protein M441DRAFT_410802 [Trichoderma asperellum CBS 433.97]PTB40709.1 hypothetical protein M441DRAFT_410802 [Trichoderma asperellum CBS 433.97]
MIGCVCQLTRKPASIALCSASGTPLYQLAVLPLPLPGLVPFISPLYGLLCQRCVAGLSEHSAPQEAHSHYIHPPQPPRPLPFCFNPHFFFSPGDGSRHDKSLLILQRRPAASFPGEPPTADARFLDGRRSGAATKAARKFDSTKPSALTQR